MKNSLFSRIVAGVVLVAFTVASCDTGFRPPKEGPIVTDSPPPTNDLKIFYLDSNNQPVSHDTGRTVMIAESEDAQGVAVVANYKLGGDLTVQVVNADNDSVVTFVYPVGKKTVPSRMTINVAGEEVKGEFSDYDWDTETYSVTFSQGEEAETFENLVLNKNVFTLHKPSILTIPSQDIRLQGILTTVALWTSLRLQIDDGTGIGSMAARKGWSWKTFFVVTFAAIAVVSLAALVIISAPAIIITAGTITIPLVTTTQTVLAVTAIVSGAAAVAISKIPDPPEPESSSSGSQRPQPPLPPEQPQPGSTSPNITVTENKEELENFNPEARLVKYLESMTFNIKLDEPGPVKFEQVYYMNPDTYLQDSDNAKVFRVTTAGTIDEGTGMEVTVENTKKGWLGDSGIYLVFAFDSYVTINKETGYVWDEKNGLVEPPDGTPGNLFILHVTGELPSLRITQNGGEMSNDGKAYDVGPKASLVFDIRHVGGIRPVNDLDQLFRIVDPATGKIANPEKVDAFPFALGVTGSLTEGIRLTVSRNSKSRVDEIRDDKVYQLLVWFDVDVYVNDRGSGHFWDEESGRIMRAEPGQLKGNLFIINLKAVD